MLCVKYTRTLLFFEKKKTKTKRSITACILAVSSRVCRRFLVFITGAGTEHKSELFQECLQRAGQLLSPPGNAEKETGLLLLTKINRPLDEQKGGNIYG